MDFSAAIARYSPTLEATEASVPLVPGTDAQHTLSHYCTEAVWEDKAPGHRLVKLRATNQTDVLEPVGFSFSALFSPWSPEEYVMIPAAVYDGNRFDVLHTDYPPIFDSPLYFRPDCPPVITDIPHLEKYKKTSVLGLRAGDSAAPAVCLFLKDQ